MAHFTVGTPWQRMALFFIVGMLALGDILTRAPGAAAALTWSAAGTLANGRNYATATLLQDGRVLAVGGLTGGPYSNSDTADLYNATTKSWSPAGKLATPRAHHT